VHAGVVGDGKDEAPVGAGDGRIHERIGGNVETDVLHAHQGALAGPTHSQGLFVGDLFVGRPEGVDVARFFGAPLDKLEDLGRGRSWVAVDTADPGVNCAETDGIVTEENLSVHTCSLHGVSAYSRGASN